MDSGRLGDYDLLLFSQLLPTPGASGDLGFKLINHHLSGISEFRIVRTCVRWLPLTPSLPPSLPTHLVVSSEFAPPAHARVRPDHRLRLDPRVQRGDPL